jgi:dipeptidyl aminopeptidase/acylaminoacyl peptidase
VFAIPAHDRIELIGIDGDLDRRIDVPGIDNSALSCECRLSWTKDGSAIHIVTRPRPKARGGVATVDADGENLRLRFLDLHVSDAAWAPQGWPLVLVPGDTVHRAGERPPNHFPLLRLSGLDAPPDVLLEQGGEIGDPAFSPDGSRIAFSADTGRGNGLWIASPNGGKQRLLLRSLREPRFTWSPDGRHLALSAVLSKLGLQRRLVLVSLSNGKVKELTSEHVAAEPPAWAPDGRWITFADERGNVSKVRRDGSGQRLLFQMPGEEVAGLSWSPDGHHLVLTSQPIPPID